MQPELLLFVHHPSYSSGLVCLFVYFLVCLFSLSKIPHHALPNTSITRRRVHLQTTVNMRDVSQVKVSPRLSCKKKTCFAQHNTAKRNNKSTRQVQTDLLWSNMRRPLILHKYVPLAQNYMYLFAKIEFNTR